MSMNLSNTHKRIYEVIQNHGKGITCIEINEKLKININTLMKYLIFLKSVDLIIGKEVKGSRMKYYINPSVSFDELRETFKRETAMARAAKVAVKNDDSDSDAPKNDELLESITTTELTDAQWHYIRANPTLSRSKIAKQLGMTKIELNAGIEKRKLREGIRT
ncbi:hypothetical protein [Paenibacillus camelliae]|uniref:hypothetical protein n=1 Tax=Paenibacillus camelliae TaxID=512410 RepID=UPI00203D985C|nr:hypothetical protein [Paenibacillus camelliae]MCM3632873.1 hypothetical protein [Paenibacillus camelliae]